MAEMWSLSCDGSPGLGPDVYAALLPNEQAQGRDLEADGRQVPAAAFDGAARRYPRQSVTAAARFDARGSPIRNDHRLVT